MILKSEDKQFKLADDGQILWQADATNPLPGVPVGAIKKGETLLKPVAEANGDNLPEGQDKAAVQEKLQEWLDRYIHFSLEPLFRLTGGDDLSEQARSIATQLQGALGILPRSALEDVIAGLDEEGRKGLRARKVRMGPLLVFLPELNKPAAVKLRATLLTLWQDKPLPAQVPKDGVVSFTVADKEIDPDYYRSIGYPVYGPRSIRVDMLDRVVCAVYDGAKDGKFKAEHKMAEWFGSNILDLYAVLEAMGHTKIYDPAEEKAKEEAPVAPVIPEAVAEDVSSEVVAPVAPEVKAKPELATFRLKRGKANEAAKPREPKKFEKK
ncbi:MAG: helicase, partial [Micavibrio aeruginosavorus]